MHKIRKIFGCCLIAVTLLACTACSGLDRLNENLKDGVAQLSDDVVIGKSNALITPYQSFEGSRTSDSDAFQATYDASVTGFDGQDILVADTDLKENECREVKIQYMVFSCSSSPSLWESFWWCPSLGRWFVPGTIPSRWLVSATWQSG